MPRLTIPTPRINANEDQVKLVEINAKPGDAVAKDQHILTIESTKAASEVYAERDGVMEKIFGEIGAMIDVGAPLYALTVEGAGDAASTGAGDAASAGASMVTAKAMQRARELGVDAAQVPASADHRVTVADVEAFAARQPAKKSAATNSRRAVILGAGGHAVTVLDALQGQGYDIVGALDPKSPVGKHVYGGVNVIGGDDMLDQLYADGVRILFLGVGGATNSVLRAKLYADAVARGFLLPPVISPRAYVAGNAAVGNGTVVLAGAVIGPNARVGENGIINHNSTLCHDSKVGDHCHLTPGAILAGTCHVGDHSVIGMAATLLFGVRIGTGCLVHNGASVMADLASGNQINRDGVVSKIPA